MPRYRFDEFVLSPRRRLLLRGGVEQPLIPRYLDLLIFLVERRHEAVHRRDIFERVWSDVIVSDSALSQAIRTIRRVLDDDPRESRFIRTVSRHGYRFVFDDVREEGDDESILAGTPAVELPEVIADAYEPLIARLTRTGSDLASEEDQREAAELLHALGTGEALRRLGTRDGHAFARALLRDTRWDVANAGAVPIAGQPAAFQTAAALAVLRLKRVARVAAARWAAGSIGGALAGAFGGAVGGLLLAAAPGSAASFAVVPVLALIGVGCGAMAGAGVGAGLSAAEAVIRSRRLLALACGAAVGGALVGLIVQWMARWTLQTLVGVEIAIGGGLEGLVIGTAAGIGYAAATSGALGGLAAPRGRQRTKVAAATALACGIAALMITLAGRPLVGGTIHLIAAAKGSQAQLTPLGRLIGEPDFGRVTQSIIGTGEGALFGLGLALGLTRRP